MFLHLLKDYIQEEERQALRLLDDPSEYPGLPKVDRQKLLVQLYVLPSFEPMTSWSVYAVASDRYRVRRVRWDQIADYQMQLARLKHESPTTYGAEAEVGGGEIRRSIEKLSGLKLPMFNLSNSFGIDGVTFGIRRQTFGDFAEFSWWCKPPAGCETIAAWYHDFVMVLESSLPAHTALLRDHATHPHAVSPQ